MYRFNIIFGIYFSSFILTAVKKEAHLYVLNQSHRVQGFYCYVSISYLTVFIHLNLVKLSFNHPYQLLFPRITFRTSLNDNFGIDEDSCFFFYPISFLLALEIH